MEMSRNTQLGRRPYSSEGNTVPAKPEKWPADPGQVNLLLGLYIDSAEQHVGAGASSMPVSDVAEQNHRCKKLSLEQKLQEAEQPSRGLTPAAGRTRSF